ncbi:Aldo/keto reductase [Cohaesibacter sp. ES.047]|uniref:aldo/keto reductase n=1 Tax=Cohaesibacter sp. ES.047 TaxID=1798205 RepID=UPI000BB89ECA|nr:aldo/keto reductase [Cohaesibacter sp. ES.047]SNY91616.1 Aldo/keto reductase [Cohaesibacter sp. ES.047]
MLYVHSNGATMPALGFGTFRMEPKDVVKMVPLAIKQGFRHIDTAQAYGNEDAVGEALVASGIARDEIFLTTKVWIDNFDPQDFLPSIEDSLKKLRVDHVDLLLLHWPFVKKVPMDVQMPEFNKAVDRGMTRHIGLSNYTVSQINQAVSLSKAPIVTNQVEYHPYLSQQLVLNACKQHGMALTSYYGMADGLVPRDERLADIGSAYGKSAAQVALRWLIQQPNVAALSKTVNPSRLAENFDIFDFSLSTGDMEAIHALARQDGRLLSPAQRAPDWDK